MLCRAELEIDAGPRLFYRSVGSMPATDNDTRQKILRAALRRFAHCGYAGTSVQDIVGAARVTKPALYYYFANKAALYQALVDSAHDERYRLIQAAAARGGSLEEKLVEILTALFAFLQDNRELMRLAYTTAFAAPGEMPKEINFLKKSRRNFDFIRDLIKKEQVAGRLNRHFDCEELAYGIQGMINVYVMSHLVLPDFKLSRKIAERVVQLFLNGAVVNNSRKKK